MEEILVVDNDPNEEPSVGEAVTSGVIRLESGHLRLRGMPITDIIADLNFVPQDVILQAIDLARANPPSSPVEQLLESREITPDQVARSVAIHFGLDFVDLNEFKVNVAAANLIDVQTARRYQVVPIDFVNSNTVLLAVADPADVLALDDIGILTGQALRPVVAAPHEIEALITQLSKLDDTIAAAISTEEEENPLEITDIKETSDDAPVVRLTHAIIARALEAHASDIHFEPSDTDMAVRYRVDGVLADANTLPKRMVPGVVSRVKVMADLDIAEHRLPQDGRVTLKIEGRRVDVRVVTMPSVHGEAVVMRLLDSDQSALSLNALGLTGEGLEKFERAIAKPYGATLVTGPTGSGKTTSLYAGLQTINSRGRSILTIEDPVEYQIAGITQIQVHAKAGLTFSTGLRSMLRADPDVIMVGEIRDRETARIAVEAALTGHLVLSTLHTNSAPAAVTRLIDMGIEPFLIASALDCVIAQRLKRTLCSQCTVSSQVERELLRVNGFEIEGDGPVSIQAPAGCSRCGHSGFKGRLGVFEVMHMSEAIRDLTLARASADQLRDQARKEGMRTLREDGLQKVLEGSTTVEEVARVIS